VIVVDASVLTEFLTDDAEYGEWARDLVEREDRCLVPEHTRLEVANSIRGKWIKGIIPEQRGRDAFDLLSLLELSVVPTDGLLGRVWELRSNVTAYDAAYVAIAEQRQCPLATFDFKLAAAPGPRCEFRTPPA
jgi:predicted nucleic acid-binding protein